MKLVGNGRAATIGIFAFIVILCLLSWRCSEAAEIDLATGVSFGPGRSGPVLGMDLRFPQGDGLDLFAGCRLWGETSRADTDWNWHAGFRTCRSGFCASLGAAYVQRVDELNGSHANFFIGVSWRPGRWHRLESLAVDHLSNAGTTEHNAGRNAALAMWRLR